MISSIKISTVKLLLHRPKVEKKRVMPPRDAVCFGKYSGTLCFVEEDGLFDGVRIVDFKVRYFAFERFFLLD
jgi:hypothetical protein